MLEQKTVNGGCKEALERYNAMTVREAKLQITYDMQGFLASMNDRREWPLEMGLQKLAHMLHIIAAENGV